MIPPSRTGYVQVLNGFINKLIKKLIQECEETYYDLYEAEWRAGKFTVSDH